MRNPQNLLIAVLLFLLLGSIGGIYYINKQYEEAKNEGFQKVKLFVADKNISENQMIGEKDIKEIELPKSAVLFRPLQKSEIVGKYAKTPIFHNEPIVSEKISAKQYTEDSNLSAQFDKFNMRFALFQNPNFALKKGDRIDIIGVYKNNVDPSDNNFAIGYTAKNIRVLDFLKNGMSQNMPSIKVEEDPKDAKEKDKKEPKIIFADELVLDMSGEQIAKTLSIMNKNHQIWMALSNNNRNDEALELIKLEVASQKKSVVSAPKGAIKESIRTLAPRQVEKAPSKPSEPSVIYETDSKTTK